MTLELQILFLAFVTVGLASLVGVLLAQIINYLDR